MTALNMLVFANKIVSASHKSESSVICSEEWTPPMEDPEMMVGLALYRVHTYTFLLLYG